MPEEPCIIRVHYDEANSRFTLLLSPPLPHESAVGAVSEYAGQFKEYADMVIEEAVRLGYVRIDAPEIQNSSLGRQVIRKYGQG
ncbi:MAG TPA: hypothetical protein VJB16_05260 [archaeon]|nr:hypothetical protein [archaeon]